MEKSEINNDSEKSKGKTQENNLILAAEKGFFSSSDNESVVLQESHSMRPKKEGHSNSKSGEILLSIVRKGNQKNFTCLLDTRSSKSMLSEKLADEKAIIKSEKKTSWETKAGKFSTSKRVIIKEYKLPQFTSHRKFNGLFHLFQKTKDYRYDAIIGQDLLEKIGIDLLYSSGQIRWGDISIPMVPIGHFSGNKSRRKLFKNVTQLEDNGQETYLAEIKSSKYESADLNEVVNNQIKLDQKQRNRFYDFLTKVKNLFLGRKGKWKGSKVFINLKEDAKPIQSKTYKIPQAHVKVFKEEIDWLVSIGLFTKVDLSEWSSPTFCIPKKKDGRIRIVTNYCRVNKVIKWKAHPLPNIMELRKSAQLYYHGDSTSTIYFRWGW